MRVAGLAVDIPTQGRPRFHFVVLDDASGLTELVSHESHPSQDVDLATQLFNASEQVKSRLSAFSVDRVVVRRADRPMKANNSEGPRVRLLLEGAIVGTARSVTANTRLGTGKDLGGWYGSNKARLDADARAFVTQLGLRVVYVESAAAALAAFK
jgi:hypothetical protein